MRTSCIKHPAKERLLMIREWQVEACDGDHCGAALLAFFEYWHNIKIEQAGKAVEANDVAEKHDSNRDQDESLVQWHTNEQLAAGMLGLYSKRKIVEAVATLTAKGFIRVFRNPNPRFAFDNTNHFTFNDVAVNDWLDARSDKKGSIVVQKGTMVGQKGTILVSETTAETTKEEKAPTGAGVIQSVKFDADEDIDENTEDKIEEPVIPTTAEEVEIPIALRTPAFTETWSLWICERRDRKKKLTVRAAKMELDDLAKWGPDRAVEAIRKSIANGWTGIFEPKLPVAAAERKPGRIAV